ncbi:MAG: Clp protease N-terminal domain-containing protein [Acholeplasmatales bacterium]|jgi:ATPase AAA-2 domain protein|nr:AAA family ATPase [Acholeplasmatales bacterium]MDD7394697.1 Clp protease N-terminal domain-containing protein [Acholeplasmatales bacterium]MDY4016639.1 Clp protease N-terminal domain-containing protein [Bacilli bacterium]
MFETFSTSALEMIDKALRIAKSLGKKLVGTEHLLLAMYQVEESICHFLLEEKDITYEKLLEVVNGLVILRKNESKEDTYSKKFQEVILYAQRLSEDLESEYVYDEHIFYVMLKEYDTVAYVVLEKLGLDIEELKRDIEEIFSFDEAKEKENIPYPFLINLSTSQKIHPFVLRNNYIEKIKYILSKKQKNNPLLIGNAGVGKTAIVEGLSEILKDVSIYQLDLGSIVAGTKYRGELEEKLTKAMEYIKRKKAILFIDEIHNIVGAGSNDGSLDIANILKPYLSRSDIKLIGATTLDEYYRHIDKDKALSRRFQNVFIDEPTEKETYVILKEIKASYEEYHNVKYSDQILQEIIEKSKLYLVRRSFPDKAIDVMDEIGTRKKSSNKSFSKLIDETIEDLTGIKNLTLERLKKVELNYPSLKPKYLQFIKKKEFEVNTNNLAFAMVNSDFNVEYLIEDLYKLFAFKKEMYLEIDLENYIDYASINNLIGSTKGYVGYEQGGILSEHILKYPLSLVYFKNIKSAHPSINQFIKSLLKKNHFLDNKGRTIYLTNTIFLLDTDKIKNKEIGFINENKKSSKNIITLKTIERKQDINQLKDILAKNKINILNFEQLLDSLSKTQLYDFLALAILKESGNYWYNSTNLTLEKK